MGEFVSRLSEVQRALGAFNVAGEDIGFEVQAGFLIPRAIFENTLPGLAGELQTLTKIINVFSEVATGSVEPIEVRQISTTDPLVYVAMIPAVAVTLGKAVDWLLETAKKTLELKQLYVQTKSLGMPDHVIEGMKGHITETVRAAIREHASLVAQAYPGSDEGRRHELENGLTLQMTALFAKIEQGMTVELRLGAPNPNIEGDDPEAQANAQQWRELELTARRLEFPVFDGEALVTIEDATVEDGPPEGDEEAEG